MKKKTVITREKREVWVIRQDRNATDDQKQDCVTEALIEGVTVTSGAQDETEFHEESNYSRYSQDAS